MASKEPRTTVKQMQQETGGGTHESMDDVVESSKGLKHHNDDSVFSMKKDWIRGMGMHTNSRAGTVTRTSLTMTVLLTAVSGTVLTTVRSSAASGNSTTSALTVPNGRAGVKHGAMPLAPLCSAPGKIGLQTLMSLCLAAVRGRLLTNRRTGGVVAVVTSGRSRLKTSDMVNIAVTLGNLDILAGQTAGPPTPAVTVPSAVPSGTDWAKTAQNTGSLASTTATTVSSAHLTPSSYDLGYISSDASWEFWDMMSTQSNGGPAPTPRAGSISNTLPRVMTVSNTFDPLKNLKMSQVQRNGPSSGTLTLTVPRVPAGAAPLQVMKHVIGMVSRDFLIASHVPDNKATTTTVVAGATSGMSIMMAVVNTAVLVNGPLNTVLKKTLHCTGAASIATAVAAAPQFRHAHGLVLLHTPGPPNNHGMTTVLTVVTPTVDHPSYKKQWADTCGSHDESKKHIHMYGRNTVVHAVRTRVPSTLSSRNMASGHQSGLGSILLLSQHTVVNGHTPLPAAVTTSHATSACMLSGGRKEMNGTSMKEESDVTMKKVDIVVRPQGVGRSQHAARRKEEAPTQLRDSSTKNGMAAMMLDSPFRDTVAKDGCTAVTEVDTDLQLVKEARDVLGKSASLGVSDAYMYRQTLPGGIAIRDSHSVGIWVVVRGGAIMSPDHLTQYVGEMTSEIAYVKRVTSEEEVRADHVTYRRTINSNGGPTSDETEMVAEEGTMSPKRPTAHKKEGTTADDVTSACTSSWVKEAGVSTNAYVENLDSTDPHIEQPSVEGKIGVRHYHPSCFEPAEVEVDKCVAYRVKYSDMFSHSAYTVDKEGSEVRTDVKCEGVLAPTEIRLQHSEPIREAHKREDGCNPARLFLTKGEESWEVSRSVSKVGSTDMAVMDYRLPTSHEKDRGKDNPISTFNGRVGAENSHLHTSDVVNVGRTMPQQVAVSRVSNLVNTPGRDKKGLSAAGKDVDTATHDRDKDPIAMSDLTYLDHDYMTREGKEPYGHLAQMHSCGWSAHDNGVPAGEFGTGAHAKCSFYPHKQERRRRPTHIRSKEWTEEPTKMPSQHGDVGYGGTIWHVSLLEDTPVWQEPWKWTEVTGVEAKMDDTVRTHVMTKGLELDSFGTATGLYRDLAKNGGNHDGTSGATGGTEASIMAAKENTLYWYNSIVTTRINEEGLSHFFLTTVLGASRNVPSLEDTVRNPWQEDTSCLILTSDGISMPGEVSEVLGPKGDKVNWSNFDDHKVTPESYTEQGLTQEVVGKDTGAAIRASGTTRHWTWIYGQLDYVGMILTKHWYDVSHVVVKASQHSYDESDKSDLVSAHMIGETDSYLNAYMATLDPAEPMSDVWYEDLEATWQAAQATENTLKEAAGRMADHELVRACDMAHHDKESAGHAQEVADESGHLNQWTNLGVGYDVQPRVHTTFMMTTPALLRDGYLYREEEHILAQQRIQGVLASPNVAPKRDE